MLIVRTSVRSAAMLLVCAAIFGLMAAPIARANSQENPSNAVLTLSQYEAELDRVASAVSELADHPEKIDALRKSLPAAWTVEAGGQRFEVPSKWISAALDEMRKHPDKRKELCGEAAEQLKNQRNEAERGATSPADLDRTAARARLGQILSAREFNQVRKPSWLSELWDQVQRWINWLLNHTLGRLLGEGAAKTVLLWTLIVAVFVFVGVWIVRSMSTLVRHESLRVHGAFPPGKTWRDWARDAVTAAGGGDYRAALHASYWCGVYKLADMGAWQLDRARTPREYLSLLAEHQRARGASVGSGESTPAGEGARVRNATDRGVALTALTRSMESAWYGYLPATRQDFDSAVHHLETLGCRLG